jgi:phosphoribosylformimino-5-aminoimidazole carboxamide ribonucleotide (ProFAR) isomerase
MLLIPAIDLKDGHCVRLKQGEMDAATVFSEDPVRWPATGLIRAPGACTWWT